MDYPRFCARRARLVALGCLALTRLAAQNAPQTPADAARPNTPTRAADDSVVLSPFVVNTDRDVGFVASSALAGGRLAGALRDTPVAYSVLTREFIDALNLTDLASANEWTVNSVNVQGSGEQEVFGNGFEVTARGVTASGQQRNFFPLNVNFDSYNLDRFDYARGPNAILFGNGTFGGTANSVTKRAMTSRHFGSVRLSYGSWDHRRATVDYNRPLTDKLALRANALWQDSQGWRDHELERKKAITLAGTWQITRNTELMIEGEVGRIERNNPPTFLADQFTGWNGTLTFDNLVTNATVPSNAILNAAGVSRYGNDTAPTWIFAPDLPMTTVENYSNTMRTVGGGASGAGVGGVPLPAGAPSVNYSSRPIQRRINAPAWQFDAATNGSAFRVPRESFALSTLTPTFRQNYQAYSSFVRHRIGDRLFTEVAGNVSSESRRTQYINARSLNDVIIDINRRLPNGQTNPMFLQPFGQGQRSRGQFGNKYRSARFAAAYQLDRTRFGDFTFNLMGGVTEQTWLQKIESMRVLRDADPRNWPFNDQVFYRYYWNGGNRQLPEIRSATLNGVTYPVAWIGDSQRPTDISYTDTDFGYVQGAIKGKFFKNRLHVLAAGRRDNLTVKRTINDNYGDYPANWNGRDYQFRPPAPADYLSLEDIRPRSGTRVPTVTTGRYQDDYNPPDVDLKATTYSTGVVYHPFRWASVFANFATSFNPSSSQLRLDGSIMPSPESEGWDVGLRFYLLDNRVNVSLTYYEGQETAQPFEIPFTNNLQEIARANVVGDLSTDRAPPGVRPPRPGELRLRTRGDRKPHAPLAPIRQRRPRLRLPNKCLGRHARVHRQMGAHDAPRAPGRRRVDRCRQRRRREQRHPRRPAPRLHGRPRRLEQHLSQPAPEHRRGPADDPKPHGGHRQHLHRLRVHPDFPERSPRGRRPELSRQESPRLPRRRYHAGPREPEQPVRRRRRPQSRCLHARVFGCLLYHHRHVQLFAPAP
jgi:outer membrane receptor protein involved in Fe transport